MDFENISIPKSIDVVAWNYDLLMEILLCLPAKSLLRFTSVCKHWQSMISTASFRRLHTLRVQCAKPLHSFILGRDSSRFFFYDLTTKQLTPFRFIGYENVGILQSCNGLMLLACGRSSIDPRTDHYIFNPTTRNLRELPMRRTTNNILLVFDPSKSPYYRVICFRREKSSNITETYDSETHSWKRGVELSCRSPKIHKGIYWNGDIYFIRARTDSYRFVLDDNEFRAVSSPPDVYCCGSTKVRVMESNGHMHCITISPWPNRPPLTVLEAEMENKGLRWFPKHHVDISGISTSFYRQGQPIDLLGIVRGGTEEDSILLLCLPGKIMAYGFLNKTFKAVLDLTRENLKQFINEHRFVISHQFIEILALV